MNRIAKALRTRITQTPGAKKPRNKARKVTKKKEKKKKKKKNKKKDKKKAKNDDKEVDKGVKKLLEVAKKMREKHPDWQPISKKDYFAKSTEFRVWLQGRGKYLDDLSSSKSHKLFDKFVDKWNSGSLPSNLYKGINRTEVDASALTRHKWNFVKNLKEEDKFALARLRDDVDTDNMRASFKANPLTRSCDLRRHTVSAKAPRRMGAAPESAYDREMRIKAEKKAKREFRKHHEMVMEELVPKATGREALIEKRKAKGAYARAGANRDDSVAAVPDAMLMGGGSSDFAAAVARRNKWRQRKNEARSARVAEAQQREKDKMKNLLAGLGMADKYKL